MSQADVVDELRLALEDVKITPLRENCFRVKFVTSRGDNTGILHHREGNSAGIVLVGGAGGGVDGPASIYTEMGPDLLEQDVSSLRLDYRRRNYLEECVLDVLIGIELMKGLGIERFGLAGWSFGGAVVIAAGILSAEVRAVVTVASQTYGTDHVDRLSPKALLVIHGTGDRTLNYRLSEDIYSRARQPKQIELYEGANHGIDERRGDMKKRIEDFLLRYLR